MTTSAMRDALLAQGGPSTNESELQVLAALVAAEDRRARRLTRATVAVWIAWIVCVVGMFVWPMLAYRAPGQAAAAGPQSVFTSAIVITLTILILSGAVLLPVLGIVLLILAVFSRRSSSISQLRASIAAIDAQLKALTAGNSGENDRSKNPSAAASGASQPKP